MAEEKGKKPKGAGKSSFDLIDLKKISDVLPVKPGSVVLDLACGRGDYSVYFSEIVGEQGLVYALDLWEEGIMLLEKRIEKQNITNIMTLISDAARQIEIDDYSVDMCLMATVLHDFEEAGQAEAVLKAVKTILKPNGCLAVLEFKKCDGPPGPPKHIRLSEKEVDDLVLRHGFKKGSAVDAGDYTYQSSITGIVWGWLSV
jgi:ubiquinone/menaquinone biosynthesis C-methylase UbiE